MQLAIHLSLLLGIVVTAAALVVWKPGLHQRSTRTLVWAVAPFLVLGIICSLLLNARGFPTREWFIPAIAVLGVGIGCGSETAFKMARWGFLAVSVLLCNNFVGLLANGYTAWPSVSRSLYRAQREGGRLTIEREWYTPLTGLYREHRAPR